MRVAQVGVRVPVERADSARLHEQRLGLVHERIALGRVAAALDAVEQRIIRLGPGAVVARAAVERNAVARIVRVRAAAEGDAVAARTARPEGEKRHGIVHIGAEAAARDRIASGGAAGEEGVHVLRRDRERNTVAAVELREIVRDGDVACRVGRQVRQLREADAHALRADREPAGRLRRLPQERDGLLAVGLVIAAVITAALAVRAVVRGEGAAVGVRDAGRDGRVRALLCAGRDLAAQIAAVDEQGERRADLRALRLREGAQRRVAHGKAEAVRAELADGAQLGRVICTQVVERVIRYGPAERVFAREEGGRRSVGVALKDEAHRLSRDVVRVPIGGIFRIREALGRPRGDRVRPAGDKGRAVCRPARGVRRAGGHWCIRRLGAQLQKRGHGLREHNGERAPVGRRRDVQPPGAVAVDAGEEIRRRRVTERARPVPRIDEVRRRERRAVRPREPVAQGEHILHAPVGQGLRLGQGRAQLGRELGLAVAAGAVAGQAGKEIDDIRRADAVFRARGVERCRPDAEAQRQRCAGIRRAHGALRCARAGAEQQRRRDQGAQKGSLHAGHLLSGASKR